MVREGWNGFNVLNNAAGRVGALDLGFLPQKGGKGLAGILAGTESGAIDTVYLLGADEIDTSRLGKAFVIYQGHHGDKGAARADVILPGAAYTEKNGTYVNLEGRAQHAEMAVFPPGDAREDWKILRALSATLDKPLPYDSLSQIRHKLEQASPVFAAIDRVEPAAWGAFGTDGAIDPAPFVSPIANFYMTDPISRSSETMAKCTDLYLHGKQSADNQELTGTYG
jgi:NADH-quinone oxidoreductase subunit G